MNEKTDDSEISATDRLLMIYRSQQIRSIVFLMRQLIPSQIKEIRDLDPELADCFIAYLKEEAKSD